MKKRALFICVLILSCSHGHVKVESYRIPPKATIAVLPLQNLSSYPRAGRIVSEILAAELNKLSDLNVLDPSFSVSKLNVEKLARQDEAYLESNFEKISNTLKATFLMYGVISEYRYTKGLAESPSVAFQLKLYDTRTKTVVWRASVSDVSSETLFKRSASLDELTHTLCLNALNGLRP